MGGNITSANQQGMQKSVVFASAQNYSAQKIFGKIGKTGSMVSGLLKNQDATRRLAKKLAAEVQLGDVFLLEGALGAGKTFFAQAFGWALGVAEDVPITSPTFALVHMYDAVSTQHQNISLLHADLYRLGAPDELWELGLSEMMEQSVSLVEWGEKFQQALEPVTAILRLEAPDLTNDNMRRFLYEPTSERGHELGSLLATQLASEHTLLDDDRPL